MTRVIIVGGRIAGSTLAARLGEAGIDVLLLERDALPSVPAASCPIIYAPAMALLDEIGADEAVYAANTPQIRHWVIEAADTWRVTQPIHHTLGRDYAYAIDRARFDQALWDLAAAQPTVDARTETSVIDLLWDGARVAGVKAKDHRTGAIREHYADWVIGADGRFSTVARKVNAAITDQHDAQPTSIYYAYWCGVAPITDQPAAHLYSTGGDYGLLFMDSADHRTLIAIEGRSDMLQSDGKQSATDFYHAFLNQHPAVQARLIAAERVTPVRGMKRIGNLYRQVGGAGWALVGDAVHQKDPLDGQGIYDALYTAKVLADGLLGDVSAEQMLADYERAVRDETLPMYYATLKRVQREIYTRHPQWFMGTLARWLYADPHYRAHWAKLFTRSTPPEMWFTARRVLVGTVRGMFSGR